MFSSIVIYVSMWYKVDKIIPGKYHGVRILNHFHSLA